jgi:hypothetical protein
MTRSVRPSPTRPQGLARRVKRGIVAGYLHEISARHRPAPAQRRIVNAGVAAPEPCAAGASVSS